MHRRSRILWSFWLAALTAAAVADHGLGVAAMDSKPSLFVNGETLLGVASPTRGVDAYLGIPFAAPPVGALRWQAPVEFRGNGGRRQAKAFAPACMQSPRILEWYRGMAERFGASRDVFADLAVAEDCLYLNVWAPRRMAQPRAAGLPVMVFVHGGSNRSGWSFEPNYHGHRLAARGVIVVSIAYRLGVFGFFSHPELAAQPVSANFGLHDQLAALRWVQRNVAAFGGDPQRVTVFGESSGAGNIAALMLSTASRGLLQRAILQSGGDFGWPRIRSLSEEQTRGLRLARALDAAAPPDLAAMRRLDAAQLLQTAEQVFRDHYHAPVLDGVIIRAQLDRQLDGKLDGPGDAEAGIRDAGIRDAGGGWPLRQLLIGSNTNEYYAADAGRGDATALERAVASAELLNTGEVRTALASTADVARALDRLATAESMLCPAQWLAAGVARSGRPVWMYEFARVREGSAAAALRAYHGAELPYVFGTHDAWLPTAAQDRRLSERMMDAWVQFARTGSPQSSRLPHWPRFEQPARSKVLRWDAPTRLIASPEPVLCRVYRERLDASAAQ